jgi:hypothetical protein
MTALYAHGRKLLIINGLNMLKSMLHEIIELVLSVIFLYLANMDLEFCMSFRHQNTGVLGYCRPLRFSVYGLENYVSSHILDTRFKISKWERLLHGVYSRKQVTRLELLLGKTPINRILVPRKVAADKWG